MPLRVAHEPRAGSLMKMLDRRVAVVDFLVGVAMSWRKE